LEFEMSNFYNNGFGWICKHCERNSAEETSSHKHSRLMREGESESKQPHFSTSALAKWHDKEQRTLVCPTCGVVELID
jgi:hypothetical protein